MSFDPISQDPPINRDFPPSADGLVINSHGDIINGVIYLAGGEEAHPTMILLHGYPGHERNFDLAQVFRRAGWNVVVFHYRGSWGSEGSYRFSQIPQDVAACVDFLRQAENSKKYRINPDHIVAVGHSLGGWAALMSAINGTVAAAASIAGVNMGLWGQLIEEEPDFIRPVVYELLSSNLTPLRGVTADDLMNELLTKKAEWSLVDRVDELSKSKLLLIAGKRDTLVPAFDHHLTLVKALEASGADIQHTMLNTDHEFSDSRIALARSILAWLDTLVPSA